MVSGTRDNPPLRQRYRLGVISENVVLIGRVKVNPAWLFITHIG